ncbi:uncharacterized protein SPAPADRAFT_51129 [Spathaspora passalidarum NRRL Y-27907]|uniref:xylan 1,4-beta-xylosidase n=1 Tax=Spathaspora passalidarum (strain NRRL Y-27907 / 11-Y1) TaxID=619300 RepID=G3ANW1_SPAPN|nr:uncharacterized protein SPAPADRAFT_51129 [Spathaspora passalidarum NRRL Y-27907]EGW32586.1 hypothetical protein SPAPADRAFT_51129 [Spathaspora passalidarum NRRL Y-27907]
MLPIKLLATLALSIFAIGETPPSFPDYNTESNPQLPPITFQAVHFSFPDCQNGPLKDNDVCNPYLPNNQRAKAVVDLFTVDELIANMGNTSPGVERLGLPPYQWWSEGLHGIARSNFTASGEYSHATSFPQPILMGGAFNSDLYKQVGNVIGTEARAFNNVGRAGLDYYSPNINPFKDPRWGRGQEVASESPVLVGNYALNYVQGLQGGIDSNPNDDTLQVAATCKHFAGYDMESWKQHSRLGYNAIISDQDLADYYFPTFQSCVRDAKAAGAMCSYNAINGIPVCASEFFLGTVIREGFDFQNGVIHSDCDSLYSIWNPHLYVQDLGAAAADGIKAGVDVNCGDTYQNNLGYALGNKTINEDQIRASVTRQYSNLIRLGYFDSPQTNKYRTYNWSDVSTSQANQLAYQAAVEGITLLKNDGTLPFNKDKVKNVAVIGPWANATTDMLGDYAGTPPYLISPLQGAQDSGFKVQYAYGTQINTTLTTNYTAALNAAKGADAIVYFGGIDNSIENEALDRESLAWPGNQLDLVSKLSGLNKPLVVVQFGAGQVDDTEIKNNNNVNSIVYAGYPGQSGGTAIWDVLNGIYAPAGRLSTTQYPASYADQVPMTDMTLRPRDGYPGRTFMWYNGEPVYEFGYGLHYTTFSVSLANAPPKGAPQSFNIDQFIAAKSSQYVDTSLITTFDVNIKNTGKVTSDYAALLYSNTTSGPGPHPNKILVSFDKLHQIHPGQIQTASLPVTIGSLLQTDTNGNKWLYPGAYTFFVDNDMKAQWEITLTGQAALVQNYPSQS